MINHLTVPSFMAVIMIFSSPVACSSSVGIPGNRTISTCLLELKHLRATTLWTWSQKTAWQIWFSQVPPPAVYLDSMPCVSRHSITVKHIFFLQFGIVSMSGNDARNDSQNVQIRLPMNRLVKCVLCRSIYVPDRSIWPECHSYRLFTGYSRGWRLKLAQTYD